jgi:uncharacterized protein involved in exopolysaccharide biosynthesis
MRRQIVYTVSAINLDFWQNEPKLEKGVAAAIVVEVRITALLAADRESSSRGVDAGVRQRACLQLF